MLLVTGINGRLAVPCSECVALFAFLPMLLFLLLLILLSIWDVPFGALCGLEEGILPNQMFIVAALIKFELIWYSAPLWDCGAAPPWQDFRVLLNCRLNLIFRSAATQ